MENNFVVVIGNPAGTGRPIIVGFKTVVEAYAFKGRYMAKHPSVRVDVEPIYPPDELIKD